MWTAARCGRAIEPPRGPRHPGAIRPGQRKPNPPMINLAVRIVLAAGGALAALFVARDSPNFGVVQGMLSTVVLVCVIGLIVLWRWRKDE